MIAGNQPIHSNSRYVSMDETVMITNLANRARNRLSLPTNQPWVLNVIVKLRSSSYHHIVKPLICFSDLKMECSGYNII